MYQQQFVRKFGVNVFCSFDYEKEQGLPVTYLTKLSGLGAAKAMTYKEATDYFKNDFAKKTAIDLRTKWHSTDKLILAWVVFLYSSINKLHNLEPALEDWRQIGNMLKMKEEFLMRKWITIRGHTTHLYEWEKQEQDTVRKCMEDKHQKFHWSDIAIKIFSERHSSVLRTCKDIRQHWNNHMNPALKKSNWSFKEDQLLLELIKQYGKKWSLISKNIEGRTQNQVKNRFISLMKRKSNSSTSSDQHISSQQHLNNNIKQIEKQNFLTLKQSDVDFIDFQNMLLTTDSLSLDEFERDNDIDLFFNF